MEAAPAINSSVVERPFDVEQVRADFPILQTQVRGKPLIYFDNAATSQKPQIVIDAIADYYRCENANVHRGVHYLSERATAKFEDTREKVRRFINARSGAEIIFTRGTTESINLVAQSYGRDRLREGDEILISTLEHHSNIVPWQLVCGQTGAKLRVIPITDTGAIELEEYKNLLNERTKLVALTHISNALGTILPIKEMIAAARAHGVPVLVDGAQSAQHQAIDVQELDCDFFAFSGHKLFGPTGIGVLYGKERLLEAMPPYHGGGEMIRSVTFAETTYNSLPHKFEAGTPNIAGVCGLGAAIDYIGGIGLASIARYEDELLTYATDRLGEISRLRIVGTARPKAAVISFVCETVHPHDFGTVLDFEGIAIRGGHHCTQPLMQRLGLQATSRVSMAFYNTKDEVDALVAAIPKVFEVFG